MDKGFYNRQNVDVLCAAREKFLPAVPGRPRWIRYIIDEVREILLEIETFSQIRYSGKYGHILTEITKPQRIIMDRL